MIGKGGNYMEKVINLLADIEEKAAHIIDRSSEEKNRLYEQLTEDLEKLDSDIAQDTCKKLNDLQERMNEEIALERQALKDDCDKQLKALETNFLTNRDTLVDKVFQNIIKV